MKSTLNALYFNVLGSVTLDRFGPNPEILKGLIFDGERFMKKRSVQKMVQKSVQKMDRCIINKVHDVQRISEQKKTKMDRYGPMLYELKNRLSTG